MVLIGALPLPGVLAERQPPARRRCDPCSVSFAPKVRCAALPGGLFRPCGGTMFSWTAAGRVLAVGAAVGHRPSGEAVEVIVDAEAPVALQCR